MPGTRKAATFSALTIIAVVIVRRIRLRVSAEKLAGDVRQLDDILNPAPDVAAETKVDVADETATVHSLVLWIERITHHFKLEGAEDLPRLARLRAKLDRLIGKRRSELIVGTLQDLEGVDETPDPNLTDNGAETQ